MESGNFGTSVRRVVLVGFVAGVCIVSGCKSSRGQTDTSEEPGEERATEQAEEEADSAESSDDGQQETDKDADSEDSAASCEPPEVSDVTARVVAEEGAFEKPVYVAQPPGEEDALYVVEKPGRIRVVEEGEIRDEPFLDFRERIGRRHNERGLLGLAFHPDYAENGRFFIYYTPQEAHKNVVAEYRRSDEPHRAKSEEVRRLVEVEDPEGNHNGGMIAFGPDGYLYVGMGDGGGAGDRHGENGNGQNRGRLLGSILRLDVDAPDRDFAAAENPFFDGEGDPRIWLWGLRNPWRFSFDFETGHLYIGDVGQNKIEEVDVHPGSAPGGANYGWRAYEGMSVYDESLTSRVESHAEPAVTFEQRSSTETIRSGCSVTGGYVYRGDAISGLQGAYLYGDYCSDDIAAFRYCDGEVVGHQRVPGLVGQGSGLASFGRDNDGELYLVYHDGGTVKRIAPAN